MGESMCMQDWVSAFLAAKWEDYKGKAMHCPQACVLRVRSMPGKYRCLESIEVPQADNPVRDVTGQSLLWHTKLAKEQVETPYHFDDFSTLIPSRAEVCWAPVLGKNIANK